MIDGKSVLAIVPARGGSKGIPLKNLKTIQGVPLVTRAAQVAAAVPEIDRCVVSTDDAVIAKAAEAGGADVPFWRPERLSGDRIGDKEVLTHALLSSEHHYGQQFDIVIMLQPTSPLRTVTHIQDCLAMLVSGDWKAVWTVSETDSKNHPLKQLTLTEGALELYDEAGHEIIARQQLKPIYHRNGIAYALWRETLLNHDRFFTDRTGALVVDGRHISIDTLWDLQLVEFILAQQDAE